MRVYYISITDEIANRFVGGVFTEARTDGEALRNVEHLFPISILSILLVPSHSLIRDFNNEQMELIARLPYNILLSQEHVSDLFGAEKTLEDYLSN